VIVDHVQDLDLRGACQAPVGDVGLPAFVRHGRFEPVERAAGSLVRLRGDEAQTIRIRQIVAIEGSCSSGCRRSRWTLIVWAPASTPRSASFFRIATISSWRTSAVRCGLRWGRRDRASSPASPSSVEPPAELVDPPGRDPVVAGHLGLRPSFDPDRRDHEPRE
jgi:hypothetical protein